MPFQNLETSEIKNTGILELYAYTRSTYVPATEFRNHSHLDIFVFPSVYRLDIDRDVQRSNDTDITMIHVQIDRYYGGLPKNMSTSNPFNLWMLPHSERKSLQIKFRIFICKYLLLRERVSSQAGEKQREVGDRRSQGGSALTAEAPIWTRTHKLGRWWPELKADA